ncbi:hypothetical protein AURDEDRAFT_171181 [Auricularia subglabra TFB-10046 SS5]|uniref:F-box domain-containing protein n=1 Tax=Auricularia subglabra (strain TFB-10046 / SS5) TaxID=717982 RepID=J0WXM3_AURST|nr:hypothetical protein AURDEDRAFT_171181 [Auricularia subglabra TFB-10046 SS5]
MAFDFDHDALHNQISRALGALPARVICAPQVEPLYDSVMRTVSRAVRDSFYRWNAVRSPLARLPLELLARCFTYPSLPDRILASHVCRSLRAAALSFPVVWSQLDFSDDVYPSKQALVLKAALTRSGQHPVRLSFHSSDATRTDWSAISAVIEQHLYHISALDWSSPTSNLRCFRPAPILEELKCDSPFVFPIDFLGGRVQKLRSLSIRDGVSFPSFCPALSTITTLTIDNLVLPRDAVGLGGLFDLCPFIQSLKLTRLSRACARLLPRRRAPRSLKEVNISTGVKDVNLIPHYLAWRTRHLQRVQISMPYIARLDLTELAEGVHTLSFALETLTVVVDGCCHYLTFKGYSRLQKSATLCNLEPALLSLRSLTIPGAVIDLLATRSLVLPSLEHLTVAIDRGRPRRDGVFGSETTLDKFAGRCPSLAVVIFDPGFLRHYHAFRREPFGESHPQHDAYVIGLKRTLHLPSAPWRAPAGVLSTRI